MRPWGLALRGRGDNALYTFCRWVAVPLFCVVYRMRPRGMHYLPAHGPAIVIMNHKALIDPFVCGAFCNRMMGYMAKKELFRNPVLRRLIVELGAFPVDRGAGDREALRTALEVLVAGNVLLMFPEGHRQRDDQVHEFMPGVAMIALKSGAPVLPLAVDGTQYMLRDGRLGRPTLKAAMGPPMCFDDLPGRNSRTYREAAQRMHETLAALYAGL
jgi:1-acyl-sn-glycerol-3-phosphate acyltransferase